MLVRFALVAIILVVNSNSKSLNIKLCSSPCDACIHPCWLICLSSARYLEEVGEGDLASPVFWEEADRTDPGSAFLFANIRSQLTSPFMAASLLFRHHGYPLP